MPTTKHKIFKLGISADEKFTISKNIENTINTFLSDSNIVYINHSVTTITEDIEEYDNLKTICKFILISIVYKDLRSSSLNVKGLSKRTIEKVHAEVKSGKPITEPESLTDFDRQINDIELKK